MRTESDQQPEIQRHRAAIRRGDFSLPLKCVLRDNLLGHGDSFFDYGCGHGDDLRHLRRLGFDCDGWDPVHRPAAPRIAADAVNLGYVLNVIEDVQERAQTLHDAWHLCRKVLVVAARIAVGDGGEFGAEYGDGVLTRLGTFQKLYTQAELREYLQGVLATEAVPAAPGVFYLFKDGELGQRHFAARYRRGGATPRQRVSQRRFEEHRPLLEPLMAKITELVPSDPPIYHHKWLFVDDDYTGFDVEQSKLRSAAWLALPGVDKSRIGRRSYWQTHVVPRLDAVAAHRIRLQ